MSVDDAAGGALPIPDGPGDAAQPSRRALIAGGVFAAASLLANLRKPEIPLRMLDKSARLEAMIPRQVAGWDFEGKNGLVLPPEDTLRDRIYNHLLTRYYGSATDAPVMLLIAYSGQQDGMLQVHRPEVCYPAGGYALLENRIEPLYVGGGLTIPTHFISARSTSRCEQLIYWTRIGNAFPERWWQQHAAVAEENLKGRIPDGVLVRLSTAAPSDKDAIDILRRFADALFVQLSPAARRVLFGDAGVGHAGPAAPR